MDECFKGDLIKDRTVILVVRRLLNIFILLASPSPQTHNLALVKPIAQYVVQMGPHGAVAYHGPISNLATDESLAEELQAEISNLKHQEQRLVEKPAVMNGKSSSGKLVAAENIPLGHVSWSACTSFCRYLQLQKGGLMYT